MTESYTETTKISYGKNIMNSLSSLGFGLILFLGSFFVLWMNEGNSVSKINETNYMKKAAIEVSADKVNRANDNKLIHVSGNATTTESLTDDIISVKNTFALNRKVEMYQWKETVETHTKDELGGGTTETKTYKYNKVWSQTPINSEDFHKKTYVNPPFSMESEKFYASTGKLGDYKVTSKQTRSMGSYIEYKNLPQNSKYKIFENSYYKGYNPENPQIGDIKISYTYIPTDTGISIIGQQKSDNTISTMPFKDSNVYLQHDGIRSKSEMLVSHKKKNAIITNLGRLLGWFLMYTGLTILINPLVVIFKVIPFVEKIVGFLSKGVMLVISLVLSLLTIAIAWFVHRPVLLVGFLVLIAAIVYALRDKIVLLFKNKKNETLTVGSNNENPNQE